MAQHTLFFTVNGLGSHKGYIFRMICRPLCQADKGVEVTVITLFKAVVKI